MPKKLQGQLRIRRYDPISVLGYVAFYQQHKNRSPSQRQIQKDLAISAPSAVHVILSRLERAGLVVMTRYGRGFRADLALTPAGHAAVQRWREEHGALNTELPPEQG